MATCLEQPLNAPRDRKRRRANQEEPHGQKTRSKEPMSTSRPNPDCLKRIRQSQCVERVALLLDVFGDEAILPILRDRYHGTLPIDNWQQDVRRLIDLDCENEKLNKKQRELVQEVNQVVNECGLTDQQWRCLVCLGVRVGTFEGSHELKKDHRRELKDVQKLAEDVLEGFSLGTVLALIKAIEKHGLKNETHVLSDSMCDLQ